MSQSEQEYQAEIVQAEIVQAEQVAILDEIVESRYTNDKPTDYLQLEFYGLTQHKLAEFIMLKLGSRKIPHKEFANFNELVYDRREELRDQEYMNVMETLAELLPNVSKECSCKQGSNEFCSSDIDEFIYCQNYSKWATYMPAIEYIKFFREQPCYAQVELKRFIANKCAEPLQIHVMINPDMIGREYIINNYVSVAHYLQSICCLDGLNHVARAILIIMNFKFYLENISADWGDLNNSMVSFFKAFYLKCDDLIYQCVHPCCGQVQQILGWTECPFKVVKKLIENNRHLPGFENIPA